MTDTESNPFKTAMPEFVERWTELLDAARSARDSLGGVVEFRAEGLPVGVGEPWALPVESHLAQLFFAIPAVKGVSFGSGFDSTTMLGSEHNDPYDPDGDGGMHPRTNNAGGILGGLTTGAPVWGRIAIKPTSSIFQPQDTVDLATGEARALELKGRHDPLIAIRAVPVVEAAAAIGLVDLFAQFKAARALGEPFPPRVVRADGDEALPS
jgi:chorismate synthase